MGDQNKSEAPRIAIKLGTSASSSSKKPQRPPPTSSLGKRQRPSHGLGGDSDSESEDDERTNGRHERITAFGANGAEYEKGDKRARADRGPLTITRQPNRDWRSEARGRQHRNHQGPSQPRQADGNKETAPADQDKQIKWGLTITKKETTKDTREASDEPSSKKGDKPANNIEGTPEKAPKDNSGQNEDAKDTENNVDKEAVEALLGQTADDRTGTRHVIERVANEETEDEVFHRDFHDAPDASTLEDYEAMPVEEFGAALLRGMGWDGKERGPKVKQVKRRPNQLGLGAKELKGVEDLGGWNHKSGSSRQQRPPKLHEYRREEDKRKERREERYRNSYKGERDRERDDRRSSSHRHYSSSHRHHR